MILSHKPCKIKMLIKPIILLFIFFLLSACSMITKQLDSTWEDDRTVYNKSKELPSLEIPSELAKK
jgi:uncharacterized lipoprotein